MRERGRDGVRLGMCERERDRNREQDRESERKSETGNVRERE